MKDQETGTFCFGWGNWECFCPCSAVVLHSTVYIMDKVRAMLMWTAIKWTAIFPEVTSQSVFKTICSDYDAGHSAQSQCVGHLIVLRPVAGFPAVLLFFVSSCFLHQMWDFQLLSASSLYHSRPLWFPFSHWWMLLWRAPGKCPVCVYEHACVCVCVCMCVWACTCTCLCVHVGMIAEFKRFTVKRCHY